MTLVERYLNAVRFFLPRRQQDDIVRELSENLASEFEDRSQALGRDLPSGKWPTSCAGMDTRSSSRPASPPSSG